MASEADSPKPALVRARFAQKLSASCQPPLSSQLAHYGMHLTEEVNSSVLLMLLPGSLWPQLRPFSLCSSLVSASLRLKHIETCFDDTKCTPGPNPTSATHSLRTLLNLRALICEMEVGGGVGGMCRAVAKCRSVGEACY